jgi:hypothetical protein
LKFSILALVFSAAVSTAFAQEIPSCLKGKTPLAIDNARVIRLKASTPVQYHDRGHVKGEIVRVFADKTGHDHFLIQIGPKAIDTLEVVYNSEFGQLPGPHEGQSVEACGDYITLKAAPKPDPRENGANKSDAIIHWVHAADPGTTHEGGYLVMDGVLCGQSVPPGGHH